jgi:hypothetical protein
MRDICVCVCACEAWYCMDGIGEWDLGGDVWLELEVMDLVEWLVVYERVERFCVE